jgi:dihydroxyacetone kinase
MLSKKLINNPSNCVNEAIEGILLTNSTVKRLGSLNVLIRSDIDEYKQDFVTLISGGGSGHEPAHAGYIGHGMLSAAVLGNVFASPSVSSIFATIKRCAGRKGVLVIVKNYTGDRLNFGMAIEKARGEGIDARMVIVEDDCALPLGQKMLFYPEGKSYLFVL